MYHAARRGQRETRGQGDGTPVSPGSLEVASRFRKRSAYHSCKGRCACETAKRPPRAAAEPGSLFTLSPPHLVTWSRLPHLPVQPRPRECPVPVGGGRANAQRRGRLLDRQPGEVAQLHE